MDHLKIAIDQANTIDACRSAIIFLREVMCCGEESSGLDLGPLAISGLGYLYQVIEDKLNEANNTTLEAVRALAEKNRTKVAA